MHCSTSLTHLPILPRLPRGLVLLLILSWVMQIASPWQTRGVGELPLPALTIAAGRCHRCRVRWHASPRATIHRPSWVAVRKTVPRLGARLFVLGVLLHSSGGFAWSPGAGMILLIPLLQTGLTMRFCPQPTQTPSALAPWSRRLHRLYQLLFMLLLACTLIRFLGYLPHSSAGLVLPIALGVCATSPDDEAAIHIDHPAENHYHITLCGAFHFFWEPRDDLEKWMLILFLRHLQRVGEKRPFLRQYHITQAFGVIGPVLSAKTKEVEHYGWNILSERYRHRVHSALPDAELSHAILKIWVPTFWLSAWDVRERLIQAQVIPNREALTVEAIHSLAKHTGFNQVRDQLLERFNVQDGQLIAKETWWLRELIALNERLIAKLERDERLTPQEHVEIEPVRLKRAEKQGDSEVSPPLATALNSVLFDPTPAKPLSTLESPTVIRCTYCRSDQVAPKSKTPRRKTILDDNGEKQSLAVVRYYCHNPECKY